MKEENKMANEVNKKRKIKVGVTVALVLYLAFVGFTNTGKLIAVWWEWRTTQQAFDITYFPTMAEWIQISVNIIFTGLVAYIAYLSYMTQKNQLSLEKIIFTRNEINKMENEYKSVEKCHEDITKIYVDLLKEEINIENKKTSAYEIERIISEFNENNFEIFNEQKVVVSRLLEIIKRGFDTIVSSDKNNYKTIQTIIDINGQIGIIKDLCYEKISSRRKDTKNI